MALAEILDQEQGLLTWTLEPGPGSMRVLSRPDLAGDFTMKRTRHTSEEISRKLKAAEQLIAQGKTVAEVCRDIEVSQPIYHRWRQQYGAGSVKDAAGPCKALDGQRRIALLHQGPPWNKWSGYRGVNCLGRGGLRWQRVLTSCSCADASRYSWRCHPWVCHP